jgi:hypothetical protein
MRKKGADAILSQGHGRCSRATPLISQSLVARMLKGICKAFDTPKAYN